MHVWALVMGRKTGNGSTVGMYTVRENVWLVEVKRNGIAVSSEAEERIGQPVVKDGCEIWK